jgi:ribosomal protein L37E
MSPQRFVAKKKPWLCKCGQRNERVKQRCPTCGNPRPKPRVATHAKALRDIPYETYRDLNGLVHGPAMPGDWNPDDCGVCGKPRSQEYRHDRDHGHLRGSLTYGKPRGLACGGNQGCNILMVPWVTTAAARGIANAKWAAGEPDAERWELIARYLFRIEAHYQAAAGGD